jgi:hypothetical protein
MSEPTLKELLEMNDPGNYLYKFIKKNPEKYPNLFKHINVFESKSIDPISWVYQTIIKDNKNYNYIQYSFLYIRARGEKSSKSLWKLMKLFNKDSNNWEKKLKKLFPNTYQSDIYAFTAIAHIVNPKKFSYISKYLLGYIGEMSIDRYIRNIKNGAEATYNGNEVIHSFILK